SREAPGIRHREAGEFPEVRLPGAGKTKAASARPVRAFLKRRALHRRNLSSPMEWAEFLRTDKPPALTASLNEILATASFLAEEAVPFRKISASPQPVN